MRGGEVAVCPFFCGFAGFEECECDGVADLEASDEVGDSAGLDVLVFEWVAVARFDHYRRRWERLECLQLKG